MTRETLAPPLGAASERTEDDAVCHGRRVLSRVIDREVVSRLVLARKARIAANGSGEHTIPASRDVEGLIRLVIECDVAEAILYVDAIRGRGLALDAIFLDLLIPAARILKRRWADDFCDLASVTIGIWRLKLLVYHFGMAFEEVIGQHARGRVALIGPSPGERFTFDLAVVEAFFGRAGWDVVRIGAATHDGIVETVRRERFDIVWLGGNCRGHLETLSSCIRAVRRTSTNEAVGIMVSAADFRDHPELVWHVGAHATARDEWDAPIQAQRLVAILAHS